MVISERSLFTVQCSKHLTVFDSYRPIALASNLSEVLEWCILYHYYFFTLLIFSLASKENSLLTYVLLFLKNAVNTYITNDPSKTFDRVCHDTI